ncbi:MAG: methionine adenosyltransferase domain-containing protein [Paracoccaceae bacterium]
MRDFVITSESVTVGHPDKLCDQISDAVVDAYLAAGRRDGVIAECAIASGVVFLSVRAGSGAGAEPPADLAGLARRVLADAAGPGAAETGDEAPAVILEMATLPEAATHRAGAHPWRMVTAFGYACDQSATAMPVPVALSHRIARGLDQARDAGRLAWMSPDAQVQVAARYADRRLAALAAVSLTCGTLQPVTQDHARQQFVADILTPALAEFGLDAGAVPQVSVFPSEGPAGLTRHSGLTGRKSADDAYGSFARRGGPALSGKDPSRADRISAYAAREAARALVEAGLAAEAEVQLSYVGGDEAPASIEVDSFGSGRLADATLSARLREAVDFRIGAIAERMRLWELPGERGGRFYRDLATYGHMGRDDLETPWDVSTLAGRLG